MTLSQLLDRFRGLDVLVIGTALVDRFLDGASDRLCREAPVPVVTASTDVRLPGGAGNTAMNLAALGARTRLVGVVGSDVEGFELRRRLEAGGVDTTGLLEVAGRSTPVKSRVMSRGQLLVRFDQGDTDDLDPRTEHRLVAAFRDAAAGVDAVVVADYGGGVLTAAVRAALAEHQQLGDRLLVVDAKDLTPYRELRPTAVKPNQSEASRLLGHPIDPSSSPAELRRTGEELLAVTGAEIVALTLDRDGSITFEQGRPAHRTYSQPMQDSSATGAGDTFVAGLTLSLAARASTPSAAEVASAAATVVLHKPWTAVCGSEELRAQLAPEEKWLRSRSELEEVLQQHRSRGRRVVFTNGCFDILHRGHISYLNDAKRLGDVLVVGLNDDGSVRALKGPDRPINRLEDRVEVLSALSCVDHIVSFGEPTAEAILRAVRPDVFAKGGDYTPEMLPEAPVMEELGGVTTILPYLSDRSTTAIVDRIRTRPAPLPEG